MKSSESISLFKKEPLSCSKVIVFARGVSSFYIKEPGGLFFPLIIESLPYGFMLVRWILIGLLVGVGSTLFLASNYLFEESSSNSLSVNYPPVMEQELDSRSSSLTFSEIGFNSYFEEDLFIY